MSGSRLLALTSGMLQFGFHPVIVAECSVWGLVLHELVRQTYVHCEERGVLLERCRVRLMELLAAADMWCQRLAEARIRAEVRFFVAWTTWTPRPTCWFRQNFAEGKIKEAKRLRRDKTSSQALSTQGNDGMKDQILALAKQLEAFRAKHSALEARQVSWNAGPHDMGCLARR